MGVNPVGSRRQALSKGQSKTGWGCALVPGKIDSGIERSIDDIK
jgi:hypothetical protein